MREPSERYHVIGRAKEVARAFESPGATVLKVPDPGIAAACFTVRDAADAEVRVLCYAFSANRYRLVG